MTEHDAPRIRIPTELLASSSAPIDAGLDGLTRTRSIHMNLMHEDLARAHIRARIQEAEEHRRSWRARQSQRDGVRRGHRLFRRKSA